MSNKTTRLVRRLASEMGYTFPQIVDEVVTRGYGDRGEAVSGLRWPTQACATFLGSR